MEKILTILSRMLSDLFLVSLFLYLAAVRIDLSLEGLVSRAFNLHTLLLILILAGVGAVLCASPQKEEKHWRVPKRLWFYAIGISLFVGSIVFEILESLSSWALLMSIAATVIVFLTSFVMIREYEGK